MWSGSRAAQVAEAEKEGAVQRVLAQGWQREAALLEPQLHRLQAQLDAQQTQVMSPFAERTSCASPG